MALSHTPSTAPAPPFQAPLWDRRRLTPAALPCLPDDVDDDVADDIAAAAAADDDDDD